MTEYLAGFFDGEGCITLANNGGLTVSVVNTCLPVLQKFEEMFKGSLAERAQIVNKKQYQWRAYGDNAKNFLEWVVPYLIDKQPQANTALEYLQAKQDYIPIRLKGQRGAHADPGRVQLIQHYRNILTKQKLGTHIDD